MSLSNEALGGLFFEFEAVRTASGSRYARHARPTQDAAEKKVKDARDLLEQAEKRQKEAEALPESTDPEAAAKASQHAKCALVIIGCKKQRIYTSA